MARLFQWLAIVVSSDKNLLELLSQFMKKICNLSSGNKNSKTKLKPSSNLTSLQNEVFY